MKEEPVGYLVGYELTTDWKNAVVCPPCWVKYRDRVESPGHQKVWPEGCKVFHVNIYPYLQTCGVCGEVIVEPESPKWPELFTGKLQIAVSGTRKEEK